MIDREYSHPLGKFRLPPCEGVKPSSNNDVLAYTSPCGLRQPILYKTASQRKPRAHQRRFRLAVFGLGGENRLLGRFGQQADRDCIIENSRGIKKLVRCPTYCRKKQRSAGLSV